MAPARRPNYALRRAVALTIVVVVLWSVIRLVGAMLPEDGEDGEVAAESTTTTTVSTTTTVPLVEPPECTVGDTTTELAEPSDWQRTVVDTELRLPADYEPDGLVSAAGAGFAERFQVREALIDDLAALREAAAGNETPIELLSAYRSVADQQVLFDRREAEFGYEEALARSARGGHSEHHLGTTVDFKTAGADDVFQSWADEPAGQFVLAHAHEYGFVLSYPEGKQAEVCYDFEPWHYRYFGRELAARIHESGLTAREYLWHWQETGSEPAT